MQLDTLPLGREALIDTIDWTTLGERDGRRLRELGFDEGVTVEALHAAGTSANAPIAVRVGRMTIALRRAHAATITLAPLTALAR